MFGKCWRSKFDNRKKTNVLQLMAVLVMEVIAENFVNHFSRAYTSNNVSRAESLQFEYEQIRGECRGLPVSTIYIFRC